jgi:transposase
VSKDGNVPFCCQLNLCLEDLKMAQQVSREDFVRAFQRGTSHAEIAKALGVTKQTVYSRARKMREAGIRLKVMSDRRGRPALTSQVNELNALIDQLQD